MPPIEVPQELRGQPPLTWKQKYDPPLAFGPFMVVLEDGTEVLGGWLWRLDDTGLAFQDHDHEHQLLLTAPAVVDGPTIVAQTTDWGRVVIRPLTDAEDTLDALQALHLA